MSHRIVIFALCAVSSLQAAPMLERASVASIAPVTMTHGDESITFDRVLRLNGTGFLGTAVGPFVHIGDWQSPAVEMKNGELIEAYVPIGLEGRRVVEVLNADGDSAEIEVEF